MHSSCVQPFVLSYFPFRLRGQIRRVASGQCGDEFVKQSPSHLSSATHGLLQEVVPLHADGVQGDRDDVDLLVHKLVNAYSIQQVRYQYFYNSIVQAVIFSGVINRQTSSCSVKCGRSELANEAQKANKTRAAAAVHASAGLSVTDDKVGCANSTAPPVKACSRTKRRNISVSVTSLLVWLLHVLPRDKIYRDELGGGELVAN